MIISREKVSISRSEWQCYIDTPDSVIDIINEEFSEILLTTTSPVYAQKEFMISVKNIRSGDLVILNVIKWQQM